MSVRTPGSWRGHLRLSLVLAALPIVAAAVCAILAPQLAPYPPAKSDLSARLRPPAWMARGSAAHLLGTDQLGRDILSRLVYGARVSLLVGTVSSLLGGTIGLALGLLSGYLRGRTDSVVAKLSRTYVSPPGPNMAPSLSSTLASFSSTSAMPGRP